MSEKTNLANTKREISGIFEKYIDEAKRGEEKSPLLKKIDKTVMVTELTALAIFLFAFYWYTLSVSPGGRDSDAYQIQIKDPDSSKNVTLPDFLRMPAPVRKAIADDFLRDQMENDVSPGGCAINTYPALLSKPPIFKPAVEIKDQQPFDYRQIEGQLWFRLIPAYAVETLIRANYDLAPNPIFTAKANPLLPETTRKIVGNMKEPIYRLIQDRRLPPDKAPLVMVTDSGASDDLKSVIGPFNQLFLRSRKVDLTYESLTKWWLKCGF